MKAKPILAAALLGLAFPARLHGEPPPPAVTRVFVVIKSHFDLGFTNQAENVFQRYRVDMMDKALLNMEKSRALPEDKQFVWTVPGWPLMAQMLGPEQEPARKAKIEDAVRAGQLAAHALPFTMHTESLELEDLVRGFGYTSAAARRYGFPLPIAAKMTDVPSHSWVMPTLLHHAGVRFLHIGVNSASQYPRVPPLFWWQGADGSRVLCAYTIDYGSPLNPPADWPGKTYLAMIMAGDNHGPPSPEELEKWRDHYAKTLPGVKVRFGSLDDFAHAVLAENPDLPVVRGDMPDTWIHGIMSMPLATKVARASRPLLPALEILDTQLRIWSAESKSLMIPPDLTAPLAKAYEQSLLYGEHTWGMNAEYGPRALHGEAWKNWMAEMEKEPVPADGDYSKLPRGSKRKWLQSYEDHAAYAGNAAGIVMAESESRLRLLAARVKRPSNSIVVYNPLPWPRGGTFTIGGKPYFAKEVPACGYVTIPAPVEGGERTELADRLQTPHFTVVFDLTRGGISSLVETATGRELADRSSPHALGQFLHERFSTEEVFPRFFNKYSRIQDGWAFNDIGKPGMADARTAPYMATTPGPWTIEIRRGEVADTATLTATDPRGLAKGYTVAFTFPRHAAYVEVQWSVADKTADKHPEGGWLCFPFSVESPKFTVGRLGAPINPETDIVPGTNRHLQAVTTGVAITGTGGAGLGLCPLDSPLVSLEKPGLWHWTIDFVPRKPAVFVNLYNNMWNTNFPLWQDGSWSSRVRFWPVSGKTSAAADLAVRSWEARVPLFGAGPVPSGSDDGDLPATRTGLTVSRPGVLVTAFGTNPDGGPGTLLRVWDQSGENGDVTVTIPGPATTATPVNLRGETTGAAIPIKDGKLIFPLKAYAPASFLLATP